MSHYIYTCACCGTCWDSTSTGRKPTKAELARMVCQPCRMAPKRMAALEAEATRWREAHDKIIAYAADVETKAKESIAEVAAENAALRDALGEQATEKLRQRMHDTAALKETVNCLALENAALREDKARLVAVDFIGKDCGMKQQVTQFDNISPEQEADLIIKKALVRLQGKADTIDPQTDVRQFMAAFNQPLPATPQWPDQETMDLRVRLVAEEFCEWLRDSGYEVHLQIDRERGHKLVYVLDRAPGTASLPKSADALIDLLYVTIGSLLAMGIDMWPLWKAVQQANMAKIGGPVVNGKQLKPMGWKPPAIDALLREQGWKGESDVK